ncbi:MAG: acetyl-CoA carboxylase subunit beta [Armatimonadetes bacterium CG2_30_59_28]|nr:acetyl-CoA carboxylase carboxyltransferase subunit beta [Armatimonadota bacterium]OIO89907.1 MAG: acetyl-CoA carboxylase subunit beta [Armatimonadetes bacterium CG2_30_59_28]PIU60464.1 MAG: acetyl-CoA carboxylase carboxyl transferase subunit beta [Armatimonadetes bacterium CG07_land_8_20_14_0_80_59_28]PIX41856.1 MAG: acetyl-CoA carboxylase carboxyl transferase subunit beta [Armatimonadetes bacterium CG_4_8_14_3_um_filter_58_9]PIY37152.1 MAG: acetyl-CoA carboxylase carboxyl transferase subuni
MVNEEWYPPRRRYWKDATQKEQDIPGDLWVKCTDCGTMLYRKEFEKELRVCRKCGYHFRLNAWERIAITVDEGTVIEYHDNLEAADPLDFPDYKDKVRKAQATTLLKDAAVVVQAEIEGYPLVMAVTDSTFMMGSMNSVVGEKITRAMEMGIEKRLPVLAISGSGGGARMHEGLLSLMQMAKTSGGAARLRKFGIPYIVLLTNPSMAGVQASFASLGDVIIAEPGALIGFTGPRVIEQTLKIKLPPDFQSSEFQLAHGMLDAVVPRSALRATLAQLLEFFNG